MKEKTTQRDSIKSKIQGQMKTASMFHLGSNPYLQMKAKQWTERCKSHQLTHHSQRKGQATGHVSNEGTKVEGTNENNQQ